MGWLGAEPVFQYVPGRGGHGSKKGGHGTVSEKLHASVEGGIGPCNVSVVLLVSRETSDHVSPPTHQENSREF